MVPYFTVLYYKETLTYCFVYNTMNSFNLHYYLLFKLAPIFILKLEKL